MRFLMHCVITIIVLCQVVACTKSVEESKLNQNSQIAPALVTVQSLAPLASLDFSSQIQKGIAAYDNGDRGIPFSIVMHTDKTWYDNLSREQRMQLGGWKTPGNHPCDLTMTLTWYKAFESKHSRPPANSIELLADYLNASKITVSQVLAMDSEKKLATLSAFINPQTGKLYQSFDKAVVEPGGVVFRQLMTYDEVVKAFHDMPGATRFNDPSVTAAWEISVKGSDGRKVLGSTVVIHYDQEPPEQGTVVDWTEHSDLSHVDPPSSEAHH